MTNAEKERYAKKGKVKGVLNEPEDDIETQEPVVTPSSSDVQGAWGLGSARNAPANDTVMCEPCYSQDMADKIAKTLDDLRQEVKHNPDALPFKKTIYDNCCTPFFCKTQPSAETAISMHTAFTTQFKLDHLDCFQIVGENNGEQWSRKTECILIALTLKKPQLVVVLRLVPDALTTQENLDSLGGMPWTLKLGTKPAPLRYGKLWLDFVELHQYFCEFSAKCERLGLEEISARGITKRALSRCTIQVVASATQPQSLKSTALDDIVAISKTCDFVFRFK